MSRRAFSPPDSAAIGVSALAPGKAEPAAAGADFRLRRIGHARGDVEEGVALSFSSSSWCWAK